MPRQEVAGRITEGFPFTLDLLEGDLDSHYSQFTKGERIHWGLVLGALPGSWTANAEVRGFDWRARFAAPGEMKVLNPRGRGRKRTSWRTVKQHSVFVAVDTGVATLNKARDIGRPAVRAIVGLLRYQVPVFLPGDLLWEGALAPTKAGKLKMITIGLEFETREPVAPERFHRLSQRMARVAATRMPRHLVKALEWVTLARSADVRSEMFMHLWLAAITLASHEQHPKGGDLHRLEIYTSQMITGIGGVTSPAVAKKLYDRLHTACDIRNDLVHRADDSSVTNELLTSLESDVLKLVDFELAKLEMSIKA